MTHERRFAGTIIEKDLFNILSKDQVLFPKKKIIFDEYIENHSLLNGLMLIVCVCYHLTSVININW